jgi:hypothetical protein
MFFLFYLNFTQHSSSILNSFVVITAFQKGVTIRACIFGYKFTLSHIGFGSNDRGELIRTIIFKENKISIKLVSYKDLINNYEKEAVRV